MGKVGRSTQTGSGGGAQHAVGLDPYSEIAALARSTPSRSRFLSGVLQSLVRSFGSPYGAIHARSGAEVSQDDAHWGPDDPRFWKDALQAFLTESLTEARSRAKLLQARGGTARVAFLSAPLFDPSGPSIGAAALVVPLGADADWTTRLAALEGLCRFASVCTQILGGGASSAGRGPDRAMVRAAACESVVEFAFAITNELRNKLGCEQAALGWVRRNRVRILSISGLDQVNERSPGVADLRSAMEECLDAGAAIAHPPGGEGDEPLAQVEYPLHKKWHAAVKGDAVASVPLRLDGVVAAVLSVRSRADHAVPTEQLSDVAARTELLLPALTLVNKSTRGLPRHAWESVRDAAESLTAPGRYRRKIMTGIVTLAALEFIFGSMSYDLTVPCAVAAAQLRHLHAPFGGVLDSANVVQGDRVRAGDVLCELDHRELDQQQAELHAQQEVFERERERATAANAPVEAQLALANQQLVRARLDVLQQRIERSRIRAPIDGVVVRGDLRKSVGAMLSLGDPLFQIAPNDRWTLEMEVPDASVGDVTAGLQGEFASPADPNRRVAFSVTRVRESAELRHIKNVYVAEADVATGEAILKPGMEGVARIHVGARRIAWVVGHRLIDYLRLNFWL